MEDAALALKPMCKAKFFCRGMEQVVSPRRSGGSKKLGTVRTPGHLMGLKSGIQMTVGVRNKVRGSLRPVIQLQHLAFSMFQFY